jgi:hypothetical protein
MRLPIIECFIKDLYHQTRPREDSRGSIAVLLSDQQRLFAPPNFELIGDIIVDFLE